ncbi:MAG: ABC transporter permease [Bacteroides sp.]
MWKMNFKQAWMLMKQNPLFSSIYVVGTGLSIALVMTVFIIYYVKFAPIYPEYNRNRTLVISSMGRYPHGKPDNYNRCSGVNYTAVRSMVVGLPHVECVASGNGNSYDKKQVLLPSGRKEEVIPYYGDADMWRVFTFRFLQGKPFTEADVDSSIPVAVISRSLARRLYATDDAVGKTFRMDEHDFKVCGVVEDVSNATPQTAGDLWLPLNFWEWIDEEDANNLLGSARLYMLVDEAEHVDEVRKAVQEVFDERNRQDDQYVFDLMGQPDRYWVSTFRSMEEPNMTELLKSIGYVLLALIFIPALNLSGMIASRMDRRQGEFGVRKAYGATNRQIVRQVLTENLLLTSLGALLGLLLSYLIVVTASEWILNLFDKEVRTEAQAVHFSFEMLFNFWVFGCTFLLCLLLNLLSALIPTLSALRRTIIQALNTGR